MGIELVGTTAAETKDPEKSLPRAINSIPIRIIMFYVFALIMIMSVTPWSSVVPDKSPFVELFVLAGLPAAASIINFVVLTSAASSANSGVFSTSRMLYGLAQDGVAPKRFALLSKRAVPSSGLTFSCICLLGGVVLIYLIPNVVTVFTMVTTVSAILFMFVWSIILCSYMVYRKQRPHLQNAVGQIDVLGLFSIFCVRDCVANPRGRYASGTDGNTAVVHYFRIGMDVYS